METKKFEPKQFEPKRVEPERFDKAKFKLNRDDHKRMRETAAWIREHCPWLKKLFALILKMYEKGWLK